MQQKGRVFLPGESYFEQTPYRKTCSNCGRVIKRKRYTSNKTWDKRKYCDRRCASQARVLKRKLGFIEWKTPTPKPKQVVGEHELAEKVGGRRKDLSSPTEQQRRQQGLDKAKSNPKLWELTERLRKSNASSLAQREFLAQKTYRKRVALGLTQEELHMLLKMGGSGNPGIRAIEEKKKIGYETAFKVLKWLGVDEDVYLELADF